MKYTPDQQREIDSQFATILENVRFAVQDGGVQTHRLAVPADVLWEYRYRLQYTNMSGYAGRPRLALVIDGYIDADAIPATPNEWRAFFEQEVRHAAAQDGFVNRGWRWSRGTEQ